MGSLEKRLEALEDRVPAQEEQARRSDARARMKECLDEIAAAKRERRAPAPWAEAIAEAIKRRRGREPA